MWWKHEIWSDVEMAAEKRENRMRLRQCQNHKSVVTHLFTFRQFFLLFLLHDELHSVREISDAKKISSDDWYWCSEHCLLGLDPAIA